MALSVPGPACGPDARCQYQDIEDHHRDHTGDVQGHVRLLRTCKTQRLSEPEGCTGGAQVERSQEQRSWRRGRRGCITAGGSGRKAEPAPPKWMDAFPSDPWILLVHSGSNTERLGHPGVSTLCCFSSSVCLRLSSIDSSTVCDEYS